MNKDRPYLLRFSAQDQIFFAKRLAMILRSGVPIMEGLRMLGTQSHSRSSTFIFQSLVADVSSGQKLSFGVQRFRNLFGEFSVNVIRVGETSGTLHENLEYLAEELKRRHMLKRKVIGALVYPAVIVAATLGVTLMLTVYIFPKIIPIFQGVNAHLPLSTRILIAISKFLGEWGFFVFLAAIAVFAAFFFLQKTARFHLWTDTVLLRIPLLGTLSQYYNLANISRTTSLLLKSDVGIAETMELVADGTRNLAFRQELLAARKRLIQGQKISAHFKDHPRLFSPIFAQMIVVGESTGNLQETFAYLSDMYEEEIEELTKNLTTMLEPILMIVMGLIVGFIAISIITPIYSITQNLTPA